jgi:hypothetical protein
VRSPLSRIIAGTSVLAASAAGWDGKPSPWPSVAVLIAVVLATVGEISASPQRNLLRRDVRAGEFRLRMVTVVQSMATLAFKKAVTMHASMHGV